MAGRLALSNLKFTSPIPPEKSGGIFCRFPGPSLRRGSAQAFPFGEGGTALAVTEEGRPLQGTTVPFGHNLSRPLRGHPPQRGGHKPSPLGKVARSAGRGRRSRKTSPTASTSPKKRGGQPLPPPAGGTLPKGEDFVDFHNEFPGSGAGIIDIDGFSLYTECV